MPTSEAARVWYAGLPGFRTSSEAESVMKRILFVISGLGAGGAEKVVSQLAQHWADQGKQVTIACFDRPDDPTYHDFPQEVSILRLGRTNTTPGSGKFAKVGDIIALRRIIQRERPEIVLAFLTKNILLTLVAALGQGVRVVCCERNNPEQQQAHWLWNAVLRLAYRRADMVICQTAAVTRCIPEAVQGRVRVIPNPIGKWPISSKHTSPKTIAAVGRLTFQKGFDILIDSFARIAGDRTAWRLQIWGDGPDRDALVGRAQESAAADRIEFMGLSDRPGSWLHGADIFVLPSRYEGFPNVLGEAMAAGLPVIAAGCDFGPAEMIEDGADGILVPVEDRTALAAALARCMDDPELRERLGTAAALSARRYAPQNILRKWDRALEELAETSPAIADNKAIAGREVAK
ncbi:glycosyltransferase family 4 protein [Allopontixanthobacter sediminis]|nr:glycosyltransferase family 4 protein [Allopontixanthobacter sediminis]